MFCAHVLPLLSTRQLAWVSVADMDSNDDIVVHPVSDT